MSLDIIFGVPSLQAHNLPEKIREERCRYLVAELICRVCLSAWNNIINNKYSSNFKYYSQN